LSVRRFLFFRELALVWRFPFFSERVGVFPPLEKLFEERPSGRVFAGEDAPDSYRVLATPFLQKWALRGWKSPFLLFETTSSQCVKIDLPFSLRWGFNPFPMNFPGRLSFGYLEGGIFFLQDGPPFDVSF